MVLTPCYKMIMIDLIKKWFNREWSDWEVHSEDYRYDINRNTDWRKITTLKRVSNDGLIKYKVTKNF